MGGLLPLPAASGLWGAAVQHAERAATVLRSADAGDWAGTAAVAYRQALAGLLVATTAVREELAGSAPAIRIHEQEVRVVQAQFGDAR